jgi:ribonuclease VapC
MIVLDASALLAVILREPGSERVGPRLSQALIGSANLAETLSRMAQRGDDPAFYQREITAFGVRIEPVTADHALMAARLRPLTKPLGLSLGDRLCLALAIQRQMPVLTADRIWLGYDFGVQIEVIR